MRANTLKRERNRLVRQAIEEAARLGVEPSTLLNPHDPAFHGDVWRLLLDAMIRLRHGLVRRGSELVGDCEACGRPSFTVGKLRAWCADCGLDMDSHEYMRLQIERRNGASAALR